MNYPIYFRKGYLFAKQYSEKMCVLVYNPNIDSESYIRNSGVYIISAMVNGESNECEFIDAFISVRDKLDQISL